MNGLKERRKAKGLTQTELADAIGVTQTTISILETADVTPRAGLQKRIDRVLGEEAATPDRKTTQTIRVLEFMRNHGSITQRDAVEFGCYRLSARIHDLREMGYTIKTEKKAFNGEFGRGYFGEYTLIDGEPI